jgi:hypothetical protein
MGPAGMHEGARARERGAPRSREEVAPGPPEPGHAPAAAAVLALQRAAGNRHVAGLLQRQDPAAPPAPPAPSAPGAPPAGGPAGDAVQGEVEGHLKAFSEATDDQAKNAAGVKAARAVISAYAISTRGLRQMRFQRGLDPTANAHAVPVPEDPRQTDILFDEKAFTRGFAPFVHTVAHELEHVRQNLMGLDSATNQPLKEFQAHVASILQVQVVEGPAGRGFLGAQAKPGPRPPTLPPQPPEELSRVAEKALEYFSAMPAADQKNIKNREELGLARDKLFERLKTEAPPALRPPPKYSKEWTPWYDGPPAPTLDILTPEYQDWQDAIRGPWNKVKASWKRLDAAFRI